MMLQILEMVQRLLSVEHSDVASLSRSQPANRPAQMHEVRLHRRMHRMHADLVGQTVRLPRVARAARGHDVGPFVRSAARQRDQMIAGE